MRFQEDKFSKVELAVFGAIAGRILPNAIAGGLARMYLFFTKVQQIKPYIALHCIVCRDGCGGAVVPGFQAQIQTWTRLRVTTR